MFVGPLPCPGWLARCIRRTTRKLATGLSPLFGGRPPAWTRRVNGSRHTHSQLFHLLPQIRNWLLRRAAYPKRRGAASNIASVVHVPPVAQDQPDWHPVGSLDCAAADSTDRTTGAGMRRY